MNSTGSKFRICLRSKERSDGVLVLVNTPELWQAALSKE
jgi:hypothetical protein